MEGTIYSKQPYNKTIMCQNYSEYKIIEQQHSVNNYTA